MVSSEALARAITALGLLAVGGGSLAGYMSYRKWLEERRAIEEAKKRREAGETDYLALTSDMDEDEDTARVTERTVKKSSVVYPTYDELLPWEKPLAAAFKRSGVPYGAALVLGVPAAVIITLATERLVANMLKNRKKRQLEEEGLEKKAISISDIPIIGPGLARGAESIAGVLLGLALLSGGTAFALGYPYFAHKHNIDVNTALQRGKLLAAAGTAAPVMVSAEDIEEERRARKPGRKN